MKKSDLLRALEPFGDGEEVVISMDGECCYYDCRGARRGYQNPDNYCPADRVQEEQQPGWEPVIVIGAD